MSDLPETKRCPYLVAALIPLLGKLSDDVADAGMSCLQDKCAMWRTVLDYLTARHIQKTPSHTDYTIDVVGYCGLAGKP